MRAANTLHARALETTRRTALVECHPSFWTSTAIELGAAATIIELWVMAAVVTVLLVIRVSKALN